MGSHPLSGAIQQYFSRLYAQPDDKDAYKKFDPTAPADSPVLIPGAEHYPHVVRGGSWDDDAAKSRCAARRPSTKDWNQQDPQRPQSIWWLTDGLHVGFRVVRPLEEQENLKGLKSQVTP